MEMEERACNVLKTLAGTTGLEPATSCVTGMRSNQLNYVPLRVSEIRMGGIRLERMTFPV